MNIPALITTAQSMVVHGKGLLAMDESNATCNRRFADAGIAQSVEMRRAWRELLLTAPGLSECISGVILYYDCRPMTKWARYAALCQEAGLVPIVEPEVLMDGTHTQARCQEVTDAVVRSVFEQLARQGVVLEALILKPNMVIAGLGCSAQNTSAEVAGATLQCLRRAVPAAVPGVMFLSGGQSAELASSRLNALNALHALHAAGALPNGQRPPWTLSFSFARALQQPALGLWSGQTANRVAAQQALLKRARCNRAALLGEYSAALEAL